MMPLATHKTSMKVIIIVASIMTWMEFVVRKWYENALESCVLLILDFVHKNQYVCFVAIFMYGFGSSN